MERSTGIDARLSLTLLPCYNSILFSSFRVLVIDEQQRRSSFQHRCQARTYIRVCLTYVAYCLRSLHSRWRSWKINALRLEMERIRWQIHRAEPVRGSEPHAGKRERVLSSNKPGVHRRARILRLRLPEHFVRAAWILECTAVSPYRRQKRLPSELS